MTANLPSEEMQALQDLFDSTNGAFWRWRVVATTDIPWNFSSSTNNPCTDKWQGITCNRLPPYHVQQLVLSGYNMSGTLPSSLSGFSRINLLDFSQNQIIGQLPSSLGELVTLQDLFMDHNIFTGFIPSSFGSLNQVERMHLGNNFLRGSIPASIGNMTSLQWLTLNYLNLSGTIPSSFSQLSRLYNLELAFQNEMGSPGLHGDIHCLSTLYNLTTLSLEYNSLSGRVPPGFGNLTRLTSLDLDHNFLTGPLPSSLGQLSNLVSFYIDHNYLSGNIPDSFGNMTKLKDLYLYSNRLSGSIPDTIGNMAQLVVFDINGNGVTGTIPDTIANLTKLYTFVVNNNKMHGQIPSFFGSFHRLGNLFIGDNHFTGTIPEELGDLRSLEYLGLYENSLHGTIPASLGQSRYLTTLLLYDNSLTGTLSGNLSHISHLNDLELNNNLLSGTVPRNFSVLNKLSVLRLFGNKFSGNLDGLFSVKQTQLSSIQLNDNKFTGELPAELFQLPILDTFAATSNCFDGTLPDTVCSATSLVNLVADGLSAACKLPLFRGVSNAYISANPVYGTLPSCVFALPLLTTLHLSGNKLSGSIPSDIIVSPSLTDLSLSYNSLTGDIPFVIQERQWSVNLDLSYNRFGGTLSTSIPAAPSSAALSLQNNRLSGHIPVTITAMTNVSILGSNLFRCALDGNDIPQNDASSHNSVRNYQCGSAAFELYYYLWMALTAVVVLLVAGVVYGYFSSSADWKGWMRRCDEVPVQQKGGHQEEAVSTEHHPAVVQEPAGSELDLEDRAITTPALPTSNTVNNTLANALATAPVLTPHVGLLFKELGSLVKLAALCTLFMLMTLVPLYIALSVTHGTLVHLYAWNVSAAFLSGKLPFALLVVFWALLLIFLAVLYNTLISRTNRREQVVEVGHADQTERMWSKLWYQQGIIYFVFVTLNFLVVLGVNIGYVVVAIKQSSTLLIIIQVLMSFFKLGWNNICAPYILFTTVQYVHNVDLDTSISISRNSFTTLRIAVTLLNMIAIPCGVVAAIAPACFVNVFASTSSVTSSYAYSACSIISPTSGGCLQYETLVSSSAYQPPFTYNYQCSGSLVTYYAPAFVNLCISSAFVSPLLQYLAVFLYEYTHADDCDRDAWLSFAAWWLWLLRGSVSRLQLPVKPASATNTATTTNTTTAENSDATTTSDVAKPVQGGVSQRLLDGNQLVITLVGYLGLLLTFGAVFPPLAVSVTVTVAAVTLLAKFRVGKFLCTAERVGRFDLIVALERELQGRHAAAVLRYGLWMLLTISCWFYTLFLFDTLGDAVGFDDAYWVLIVFPVLPFVLYACCVLYGRMTSEQDSSDESSASRANTGMKSDDFEMSVGGTRSTALQLAHSPTCAESEETYNALRA